MFVTIDAKILDVISKEYEIEGRKGTSNKIQLLADQNGIISVHTVKYDPKKYTFINGIEYRLNIKLTDTQRGINAEVESSQELG